MLLLVTNFSIGSDTYMGTLHLISNAVYELADKLEYKMMLKE